MASRAGTSKRQFPNRGPGHLSRSLRSVFFPGDPPFVDVLDLPGHQDGARAEYTFDVAHHLIDEPKQLRVVARIDLDAQVASPAAAATP